jgi:hypothetical protein
MVVALPLRNDLKVEDESIAYTFNLWSEIANLKSYDLGGVYAVLVSIDVLIEALGNFYVWYLIGGYLRL